MKFLVVFLLLACSVLLAQGQCPGRPRSPRCRGRRNVGRRGIRCSARAMWYYDASGRTCRQLAYRGCGGNNNRFCTREECARACPGR